MALHLFKSYSVSFRSIFNIFLAWFCTFLVIFIPKYLIFFVNIVNGIFATIKTSIDGLYMLILYPATSLKSYCFCFIIDSLGYVIVLDLILYPIIREW